MSAADQVRRVFADLTRYPEEILDSHADLEADLGIDSVKRMEILGRLREVLALPADLAIPERGLNSIAAVTAFVEQALGATSAQVAAQPPAPPQPAPPRPAPPVAAPPQPAPPPRAWAPPSRASAPRAEAAPQGLAGRIALVTGSGHGVGAVLAEALAAQGCRVVINSFHSRERGEATAARIREAGGDAIHLWASVVKSDHRERLFGEIGARFGGLDIFVSNASNGLIAPTEQITEQHWEKAWRTNVVALHQGALLARPLMRARGGGKILCISSPGAQSVIEHFSCMGPAKAAMEALVRYLAVDLGPDNIQVNALSAGPVYGELLGKYPDQERLIPFWESRAVAGRIIDADELVTPALHLLSSVSDAITGAVLRVDHGGALRI